MGKGADHQAARVSALMEAIERVSAEGPPSRPLHGCFRDLGSAHNLIDPSRFDLPPDTAFNPDREIDWTEAHDLFTGKTVLIPTDLAICPPREGVLSQPDTNGLASGNSRLEATVHGLCEVIERDAMGQWAFQLLYGDRERPPEHPIDLETLPQSCIQVVRRAHGEGLRVNLSLLESNIDVPVIHAVMTDPRFISSTGPAARRFDGFGCHPDAEVAASRALNEAAQSRLAIIQGGRDSYNRMPRGIGASDNSGRDCLSSKPMPFQAVATHGFADLADDLAYILSTLTRAGFDCAVVSELTLPGADIAVIRVRVAGLSNFFVDRSRVGWRTLAHLV